MDWLAPVNTLIGAGIGIGSTLLADRQRWRRDRVALAQDTRRQAYAAFMGALSDVYQQLDELGRGARPVEDVQAAAHEVFVSRNLYPLRYELALIAPWEVMEQVNQAFWSVRDLRDLVAGGGVRGQPEFGRHLHAYLAAAEKAQSVMRRDLGTSWPQRVGGSRPPRADA